MDPQEMASPEKRTGWGQKLELFRTEVRDDSDWALFLYDSTGMLAVCSTYRNYAFRWTHAGPCFRTWLVGADADSIMKGFMHAYWGRPNKDQARELKAFMKDMWPLFIENVKEQLAQDANVSTLSAEQTDADVVVVETSSMSFDPELLP